MNLKYLLQLFIIFFIFFFALPSQGETKVTIELDTSHPIASGNLAYFNNQEGWVLYLDYSIKLIKKRIAKTNKEKFSLNIYFKGVVKKKGYILANRIADRIIILEKGSIETPWKVIKKGKGIIIKTGNFSAIGSPKFEGIGLSKVDRMGYNYFIDVVLFHSYHVTPSFTLLCQ
ncbi:MAG: hypothetical protein JRI44_06540 [Deltaproteobacteria bacterium]|nr:hypothetical protein [Deltaproteobacteria bacterium]